MAKWVLLRRMLLGWALLAAPAAMAQPRSPAGAEGGAKVQRPAAPAQNQAQNQAQAPGALPLDRGYYVEAATPCNRASNATLQLLRRNGIGGARDFCEFQAVVPAGGNRYRVTQRCSEIADSSGAGAEVATVIYELAGRTGFRQISPEGGSYAARFCAQRGLPTPWRNNDIRDLVR